MGLVAGGPFAGSAAIAVSASADALPCGVATAGCAGTGNLVACVDSYYASDRACGTAVAHPTGVVAALAGQTQPTPQLVTTGGFCVGATMTEVTQDDGLQFKARKK